MNELRQILINAEVPESIVDDVIKNLELKSAGDLRYYTSAKDYEDAGVTGKLTQRKLVEIATDLAENARKVKADEQRTAEMNAKLATEVPVLNDIYADDEAWINALRQDGFLEFDDRTYIAGIKALLAANIGVFGSVTKLIQLVSDFALENAKPAPRLFYDLQEIITKRKFGLIVAATDKSNYNGVPIYATAEDMDDLIERMRNDLVPNIMDAVVKVVQWYDLFSSQSVNEFFIESAHGSTAGTKYPNPAPIIEAGQNLRLSINRTFAGNGIQKALAIYNEYKSFVKILNDAELPKSIGAVDRDGVLTRLGFNANAAAVRSERFIINFVIHIMKSEMRNKDEELKFFTELHGLVQQIDWSALTNDPEDADIIAKLQSASPVITAAQPRVNALPYQQMMSGAIPQIRQMNGQPAGIEVH